LSGVLAIIDETGSQRGDLLVDRMLTALARRGDSTEVWRGEAATIGGTRFGWEMSDGFGGRSIIVCDGDLVVVADASIYYRSDLERKLRTRGVMPNGESTADVIAAAYRAWGTSCPLHLEGDYAFVVYDRARRNTFAARDFMGRRPLYYTRAGGSLIIASAAAAVLEHPGCSRELDEVHLAELVCASSAGADRTPYAGVKSLPAASSLVCDSRSLSVSAYWRPTLDLDERARSFDDVAAQLRELLTSAILERTAREGPTALWLSGGYDSSIMYGVGNEALDRGGRARLHPLSFGYPPGDAAREDDLIEEIARFWNAAPRWLSIDNVSLLADAAAHASESDVPFQHAFENWLRALLAATRAEGCRVALYGDGGDQLFAVSTIFLRDLFAGLRWRELKREWRALGSHGVLALWSGVIRPVLAERLRGVTAERRPKMKVPAWMQREFVERHEIEARGADVEARFATGARGRAGAETIASLANAIVPRVLSGLSALALDHSMELRAPLLDQRVVEFALRRPRAERASDGAVKHVLREAGRGVVPASVLAPRGGVKTGALTGYFERGFRSDPDGIVSGAFSAPLLAALGIVDAGALQQAWRQYKSRDGGGGSELFLAFQVELWLRARMPRS
jgi:asparagine synthase (glutamine-hydrolysing)